MTARAEVQIAGKHACRYVVCAAVDVISTRGQRSAVLARKIAAARATSRISFALRAWEQLGDALPSVLSVAGKVRVARDAACNQHTTLPCTLSSVVEIEAARQIAAAAQTEA